ncbi:E3 ubiquitin-protein ligase Rnf220 isoform X2 [Xenopus laevis]|uniref:E3 ubiquitin-protein ligase Rnf220 isoform X2 n=1 Tax=Xenopus laevis TaxID=8355 RepID=A0A8J1MND3_XENLA|nr:E3 ubiquitin-protein ligase Rnf220 isoform X2 [Xenopus laevis]
MESSSGLINPLTSTALLVMATSSNGALGVSQQPPLYTVPMSIDKPPQISYLSQGYPFLYPSQEHLNSACPPQLLSLHSQYGHPRLERAGLGVLGYGALHPFGAFHLAEGAERLQAGYLNPKRLKGESDPSQIRYVPMDTGMESQHIQGASGVTSTSHRGSPKPRTSSSKRDKKSAVLLPLQCPLCQKFLQKEELSQHLQQEMDHLTQRALSESDSSSEATQNLTQSPKQAEDLASESPLTSSEDGQKLDRQQIYQQIKWNREERLGARAGRCKKVRVINGEIEGSPTARNGDASDGNHWEEEIRRSEKPLSTDPEYRGSPASSYPTQSEESDIDEGSSCTTSNEKCLKTMRDKIQELTEKLKNTHTCHICLGTKKLCPQCNTITSPCDLRRVYL